MSLTVSAVERAIGMPARDWAGKCHEVAVKLVQTGLVKGEAVYGVWTGSCGDGLFGARPFTHHGWVVLPDGTVIDPTRWVFEGVAPYIYEGPSDHYDLHGDETRRRADAAVTGNDPDQPPEFDPDEPTYHITPRLLTGVDWTFVEKELGLLDDTFSRRDVDEVCRSQLRWLAHLPVARLGVHAKPVYEMLDALGCAALIPIDHKLAVMAAH